jgi:hypothetical protein
LVNVLEKIFNGGNELGRATVFHNSLRSGSFLVVEWSSTAGKMNFHPAAVKRAKSKAGSTRLGHFQVRFQLR